MLRSTRGQATVELVALLPLLALLVGAVWQAALLGHGVWSAGAAARAGSRALAVGADPVPAARRIVASARVREGDDGEVTVTVPVRAVSGGATLARVSSTARFVPQR